MQRLFVYGTLKRGFRAHRMLEEYNAVFLNEARTVPKYQLYEINWFPGMVIDEYMEGGVTGEVYSVTDDCMERLDQYEGAPSLFRRHEVELEDGTTAVAYLFNEEFTGRNPVAGGVWDHGRLEET